MSAAVAIVLTLAVGGLGLLVVGLLRSHAEILRTLGPVTAPAQPAGSAARRAAGDRAPNISGRTPTGSFRRVAVGSASGRTVLAFLTTGCETCQVFWRTFADPIELWSDTRLVIVTKGEDDESPSLVASLAPADVVTVMSSEAWADFGVPVAPYFVLVEGGGPGVLAEGGAGTWPQAREMLDKALRDAGAGASRVSRREVLGGLGAARRARADRELQAAGIAPDDPSLHPTSLPVDEGAR